MQRPQALRLVQRPQKHRPRHLVNREGRTRGLVRCEGWPRDLRHEGRCRDIGPGTSAIGKGGPGAWSDVKVGPETLDVKVGPDTSGIGLKGGDIGPGTSSIVKVGPWAWSDVKVGPETRDVKVGPETSDKDSLFSTCRPTAYGLLTCSVFGLFYLLM